MKKKVTVRVDIDVETSTLDKRKLEYLLKQVIQSGIGIGDEKGSLTIIGVKKYLYVSELG